MDNQFKDIEINIKKKNQILFTRESPCLAKLRKEIANQKHYTLIMWAFDCMKETLIHLEKKEPNNLAFNNAIEESKRWAKGEIKMPQAKRAILDCHAQAKKMNNPYEIALCHAIGQGCGTVHVTSHALGLPFYELSAIVIAHAYQGYEQVVIDKIAYYQERLQYWKAKEKQVLKEQDWASFIIKEKVNKEKELLEKGRI